MTPTFDLTVQALLHCMMVLQIIATKCEDDGIMCPSIIAFIGHFVHRTDDLEL